MIKTIILETASKYNTPFATIAERMGTTYEEVVRMATTEDVTITQLNEIARAIGCKTSELLVEE